MCDCKCLESMTPAQRALVTNGCGGKGGFGRPIHWFSLEGDCDCHDVAYSLGGTEADRLRADNGLRDAILARQAGAPWWKRIYYRVQARLYYDAVRRLGGKFFAYSKAPQTCEDLLAALPKEPARG